MNLAAALADIEYRSHITDLERELAGLAGNNYLHALNEVRARQFITHSSRAVALSKVITKYKEGS